MFLRFILAYYSFFLSLSLFFFIDILHASVVVMFLLRYKKCKWFIQYAIVISKIMIC